MSDASIWKPGNTTPLVNGQSTAAEEYFVATEGQTLFNLVTFTYSLGAKALKVFVNGVRQRVSIDYQETSTSSFSLTFAPSAGDIIVAEGIVGVAQLVAVGAASTVSFTATAGISADNVQAAIEEVAAETFSSSGGTITGPLVIGTTGSIVFEGATDDAFETTFAVVDPTADRTITFPNDSITVAGVDKAQQFSAVQRCKDTYYVSNSCSIDLSLGQDFSITGLTGAKTLSFSNDLIGQHGCIWLNNPSGYAIGEGSGLFTESDFFTTISATGYYVISYWCLGSGNILLTTTKTMA
jgi:hypothetical protein